MARHQRTADDQVGHSGVLNDLSGTVLGPSLQAGTIHGGVHVHVTPDSGTPVPRQLLPPPAHFTGRQRELAQLDEWLRADGPMLAVLSGPGGVGKTALALCWAHGVRDRFADGHLYVDLAGFSGDEPMDPGEALANFLHALGVAPQRVPATVAGQAALYRSLTADRAFLVILDNAYSPAQVRVLVPASASSVVIVTSRARLVGLMPDGARPIEVAPLPVPDAVQLLTRAVGPERITQERAEAEDLAEICGGLPIALCVTAARLATRPKLSVARVAAELADETGRLVGLSRVEGRSVQAVFDASYRLLDAGSAALYRRLGLHPGPDFGRELVEAVLATDEVADTPTSGVDALLEANLLEEVDEDRYRFHDLLRLHAKQKAEDDKGRAILEWYLAAARAADSVITPYRRRLDYVAVSAPTHLPVLGGREHALGWLERERANLVAAGRAALEQGYAELAWHLADAMWPLFLYRKHYRDRAEVDQRGVVAAREWGNAWAEAVMLKRLGRVRTIAGDYPAAERHTCAAILRYQEAGDVRGGLDALEGLADLYRDSGREGQAAVLLGQVLAANRELGDERGTALTLINLGMLLPRLGRAEEAVGLLREAEASFAGLADVDPYNGVRILIGLARALLYVGDLPGAERAATDAANGMRRLGSEHERAEALDLVGQAAERRGDAESAGRSYRSALEIFDALGSKRASEVRARLAALRTGGGPSTDLDPELPAG